MGILKNLIMKFAIAAIIATVAAVNRGDGYPKTLTKCSQTKNPSTKTTGLDTRKLDNLWLIATSMNPRTGLEQVNASTPGNAEVPEFAKDKAGAMVMMPARKFTSE